MELLREGGVVLRKLVPLRKRVPFVFRKQIPEIMSGMEQHLKWSKKQFQSYTRMSGDFEAFLRLVEGRQYALGYLKDILKRYGGIPDPPRTPKEELLKQELKKVLETNGVPYYARDRRDLERTYNTLMGKGVLVKFDGKEDIRPNKERTNRLIKDCSDLEKLKSKLVYELALRRFELSRLWTATALAELFPQGMLRFKKHLKVMIWRYYKDGRIKCRRKAKIVKLLSGVILDPENPIYEVCDLKTGEVLLLQQSQINPPGTELTIKGVQAFKAKFNSKIAMLSKRI